MEVKTFQGGAHIPHYKSFTEDKPITKMSVFKVVIVPLSQHLGAPNEPLVKVRDKVEMGQKIGDSKEHRPIVKFIKRVKPEIKKLQQSRR